MSFSLDGTANAVMWIGSRSCDAVGVFSIMDRCVCGEQTTASLTATVAARTKVVSIGAVAFPDGE